MQKSKLKVVLISLFAFFVVAIGGALYYASTKITPEEVKKQALTQLQATFPKADVKLGHIDLSLGFSIRLKLEKLEMTLPQRKGVVDLVKVDDLVVKIPIWAVLTGGGSIDIELQKPMLNYTEYGKGNNWTLAMEGASKKTAPTPPTKKETKADKEKSKPSMDEASGLAIPGFLANSRLNLKLIDVLVNYRLKDKSSGKIDLSRFLIKNLNFKSETAFELASKMKFDMGKDNSVAFQTLVIGTFNLAEMISKESFSTTVIVTLSDFDISSMPGKIPTIKTDLKALVDKNGDITGTISTSFEDHNKISAKYAVLKSGIKVEDIKIGLFIEDLAKMAGFSNPLLDFNKSQFNLNGNVNIDSKQRIAPSLIFSLEPGVKFQQGALGGLATLNGSYRGSKIKLTETTKLLNGNIIVNVDGNFDLNQKKFDIAKMKPFKTDIAFNNLNFTREMIQELLYGGKKEKQAEPEEKKEEKTAQKGADTNSKQVNTPPLILPPGTVSISWNQLKIGPEDFNGKAKILVGGSKVTTEHLNFTFSKGEGNLTHSTNFIKGAIDNNFNFKLTNLDLIGLKTFLPPMMEAVTGTFTGKVNGKATLFDDPKKGLTHDVNVDVRAVNGEIKGLDIKKQAEAALASFKAIEKFSGKISKKLPDLNDKFESLRFVGNLKQNHYVIKDAEFIGVKDKIRLTKVRGNLYPTSTTKEGIVDSDFLLKTSWFEKPLKEHAGLSNLPMRLKGIGFGLSPDSGYILERVSKAAVKYQTKKVAKKAKAKAKKEAKKAISKQIKKIGGDKVKEALKKFKFKF